MSDENPEKLFLQEKPTLAILFIGSMGKTYASIISKEIDSTFAHTTRILAKMEQCGLIRFTFEGRIKFVELTEYGKEVESALKEFRNIVSEKFSIESLQKEVSRTEDSDAGKEGEGEIAVKEETENPVQAKELDSFNSEILEKIKNLKNKMENIYRDSVEQGEGRDSISRKLGPYTRDIKKLQNQIERAESPIDETVILALKETEILLESYLKR